MNSRWPTPRWVRSYNYSSVARGERGEDHDARTGGNYRDVLLAAIGRTDSCTQRVFKPEGIDQTRLRMTGNRSESGHKTFLW